MITLGKNLVQKGSEVICMTPFSVTSIATQSLKGKRGREEKSATESGWVGGGEERAGEGGLGTLVARSVHW